MAREWGIGFGFISLSTPNWIIQKNEGIYGSINGVGGWSEWRRG